MKVIHALATVATLSIAVVIAYYMDEVRVARDGTPGLVAQAWAQHGRRLPIRELPPERLSFLLAVEDPALFRHRGSISRHPEPA